MDKSKFFKISKKELFALKKTIRAAVKFERMTGRKLGITGSVGEILAASLLNLSLSRSNIESGHDAIDLKGNRVQIKTRAKQTGPTGKFGMHKFDYVLLVILTKEYSVSEIWKASNKKIDVVVNKRKRRNPTIASFKKVGRRVFPN
jgi:hypothetical protein